MKTIKAFQTSDGELHQDEGEALKQEFMITIRGLLQSNLSCRNGVGTTTTEVAHVITRNPTEFRDAINEAMRKQRGFDLRHSVKIADNPGKTTKGNRVPA